MDAPRSFHLHMISDATGETLVAIAKAVRVQYSQVRAIEHIHPLVRSRRELDRVLKDVEATPGIVLYTIVNQELAEALEQSCKRLNIPCVSGAAHHPAGVRILSRHAVDADGRRPARARCRLFPAHRGAEFHHAA